MTPNQQCQITEGLTVHQALPADAGQTTAPRQLGELVANVAGVIDELTLLMLGTHYTCSLAVDTARKHGP